jgi:hypothetical protein
MLTGVLLKANDETRLRIKREREEEGPSIDSSLANKRPRENPTSADEPELEYSFSRSVKSRAADPIDLTED